MLFGVRFPRLRLVVVALLVLSQVYLFVRIREAILGSRRSDRFKGGAIRLVAMAMAGLFLINTYLLFLHLPWADPPLAVQIALFYPVAVWNFGSLFSALVLYLTRALGRLGRKASPRTRSQAAELAAAGDPGRRRFLQVGVGSLASRPILYSGYGAAYASKAYEVETLSLPFGRSLRVVQLTDIHAGIYMNRGQMRRYADQVVALEPDLFVMTGDFLSNSMTFLPGCLEEMARVRPRYGTFASLGNHEHLWGKLPEIEAQFRRHRLPLLTNTHVVIQTPQGPVAIVGIDDLVAGQADLDLALRGLDPAIPAILLSHRPEIFPRAAARGIRITLSGHYHGGQVKLPLPGGDLSIAHLRTPYPEGLFRMGESHLYVSRGIGTTFTPVRLNASPEVTLLQLSQAELS